MSSQTTWCSYHLLQRIAVEPTVARYVEQADFPGKLSETPRVFFGHSSPDSSQPAVAKLESPIAYSCAAPLWLGLLHFSRSQPSLAVWVSSMWCPSQLPRVRSSWLPDLHPAGIRPEDLTRKQPRARFGETPGHVFV